MAHSILTYQEKHAIFQDNDLLDILSCIQEELQSNPKTNLAFVSDFLASDMIHINGGIDPDFETNVTSNEALEELKMVLQKIQDHATLQNNQRIADCVYRMKELFTIDG